MCIHMYWEEKNNNVGKRVMVMEVPGKRTRGSRSVGGWITSRTTCRRELSEEEARKAEFNGYVS